MTREQLVEKVVEVLRRHEGSPHLDDTAEEIIESLSSPSDETLRGALEQANVDILVTLGACRDTMSAEAVEVFQRIARDCKSAALTRTAEPREEVVERNFAWTPGAGAYKHYPQYVNLTGNLLTVRGPEFVNGDGHYDMGPTVSIELPDGVLRDFAAALSALPAQGERLTQ